MGVASIATLWTCSLLALTYRGVQCLQTDSRGSEVVALSDDDFDANIGRHRTWVLMIYSPSCPHCHQMMPVLDETSSTLHDVQVGKIDGDQNRVTFFRFMITHYPSVFVVHDGHVWQFPGPWKVAPLLHFVQQIRDGELDDRAWPWFSSPLGPVSRVKAAVLGLPRKVYSLYVYLQVERGYSQLAIIGMALGAVLGMGVMFIACMDLIVAANPNLLGMGHAHIE